VKFNFSAFPRSNERGPVEAAAGAAISREAIAISALE